jgi:hypothetical protein
LYGQLFLRLLLIEEDLLNQPAIGSAAISQQKLSWAVEHARENHTGGEDTNRKTPTWAL